jgi:hypothetical protein
MRKKENSIDPVVKREMGAKLANFRHKLGVAIGAEIEQIFFAKMFGVVGKGVISAYEKGRSAIPGVLFYSIWKTGNSVDGIFAEEPITDEGKERARELYREANITLRVNAMDERTTERAEKEIIEHAATKSVTGGTVDVLTGSGSRGNSEARKHARRRDRAR